MNDYEKVTERLWPENPEQGSLLSTFTSGEISDFRDFVFENDLEFLENPIKGLLHGRWINGAPQIEDDRRRTILAFLYRHHDFVSAALSQSQESLFLRYEYGVISSLIEYTFPLSLRDEERIVAVTTDLWTRLEIGGLIFSKVFPFFGKYEKVDNKHGMLREDLARYILSNTHPAESIVDIIVNRGICDARSINDIIVGSHSAAVSSGAL